MSGDEKQQEEQEVGNLSNMPSWVRGAGYAAWYAWQNDPAWYAEAKEASLSKRKQSALDRKARRVHGV